ncbi:hypothetical protein [Streptomyces sp. NBC_00572]|uniref:hypothetical protein n=1 Tax=Streptomyces sp. NBC_00572 TaxID=2903664 RepID=UPI0022589B30|nr:hypothetical protein [Streptomyces sp. NBC_00572]MCX4984707.1 hypothetical protein [Streptomyces sp. NBC_00572]
MKGPQRTLCAPAPLWRTGANEVLVLDLAGPGIPLTVELRGLPDPAADGVGALLTGSAGSARYRRARRHEERGEHGRQEERRQHGDHEE